VIAESLGGGGAANEFLGLDSGVGWVGLESCEDRSVSKRSSRCVRDRCRVCRTVCVERDQIGDDIARAPTMSPPSLGDLSVAPVANGDVGQA